VGGSSDPGRSREEHERARRPARVFETALGDRSAVDTGRGTEIFVRRNGKWVDVGWHLDNGPFVRKDERWIKVGPAA
jgi:hypothetical protein